MDLKKIMSISKLKDFKPEKEKTDEEESDQESDPQVQIWKQEFFKSLQRYPQILEDLKINLELTDDDNQDSQNQNSEEEPSDKPKKSDVHKRQEKIHAELQRLANELEERIAQNAKKLGLKSTANYKQNNYKWDDLLTELRKKAKNKEIFSRSRQNIKDNGVNLELESTLRNRKLAAFSRVDGWLKLINLMNEESQNNPERYLPIEQVMQRLEMILLENQDDNEDGNEE